MKFQHDSFLLKFQWFSLIPCKDCIFNTACRALCKLFPSLFPVSPSCSAPAPDPQSPHCRPTTGQAARWTCDFRLGFQHTLCLLHCASQVDPPGDHHFIFLQPPKHFLSRVHRGPFTFLLGSNSPFSLRHQIPSLSPFHTTHVCSSTLQVHALV